MAMAPIAAGYAPFALLVGREAAASPEPLAGWAANFLVYGGSAQLSVSRLLTDGAALATVVLTGLLIQARLLVYSASLAPLWRHRPLWWRAAAAAVVIDPTWALMHARHARPGTDRELRAYFVGAVAALTALWVALVTAGMMLVTHIPTSATLDLVAPLALCALVVPQLRDRANLRAAIAAALVVLAGTGLPTGLPILAAMAAGVLAGSLGGDNSRDDNSADDRSRDDNPKGGTQR